MVSNITLSAISYQIYNQILCFKWYAWCNWTMSHLWWYDKIGIKCMVWLKAGQNLISFRSGRILLCKMDEDNLGEHVHKGHRRNCEACKYHCSICGNRAMDETRTRFIARHELYENGGTCSYKCHRSELRNYLACYHCGRYAINRPFCARNCKIDSWI